MLESNGKDDKMRLTVLGCYGPYPPAGQNCSGYLLQDGDTSVLLDCGNGVLSRLRYHLEPWDLNAVVLSHLHSDHVSDLMIMRYAIMIKKKGTSGEPLAVYAPGEPSVEFDRLSYKKYITAHAVSEGSTIQIGDMHFRFSAGKHSFPSHFTTVEINYKKFVFSGDTEAFPEMVDTIRGADVFLCEANYLREDINGGSKNHLAAYQAAEAAKKAGVGRLVLTHLHPERDPKLSLAEAKEIFQSTELARAGSVYTF
jgi:ribonuclease BN (tRNA processing enzyme)